ncbi:MAG: Lrp/AsnC family transcriptional regulator [Alphaproteobacteria bacterium]
MDKKDRQIIRALQENGRLTNQDLAEIVNLSPSPCLRRVKNLEKSGLIKGYTAIIDQKAYGMPLTAFLRVRLERHAEDTVQIFEREVRKMDEILDCFVITGNADYLLRVIVKSLDAYEDFIRNDLQRIAGVASIDSSFAFGTVKQSHIYPRISSQI